MIQNFPLITIGITSFNAESSIKTAITSAFCQDYPNIEIVIVDDCSSDSSCEVINATIKGHENVNFFPHKKNTGFAGALNTIINNAKGEFIAIFDDDDVSRPQRISKQYNRITEYERDFSVDSVLCHVARIQTYENGLERYEKTVGTNKGIAPFGEDFANRVLYGDLGNYGTNIVGSCANCARMGRTKVFKSLKGFDATMRRGEDTDFSIRFALSGGHFVGLEEPLVHQIMTTGDEKTLDKEYNVEKAFTQKYQNYLESIGWYDFAMRWLDIRYANYHKEYLKFLLLLSKLFFQYPIKTIKKLLWSIPANDTRKTFKKWHLRELDAQTKDTQVHKA
jgi:glycosyltransferase involved in cell wall biosynthesis